MHLLRHPQPDKAQHDFVHNNVDKTILHEVDMLQSRIQNTQVW